MSWTGHKKSYEDKEEYWDAISYEENIHRPALLHNVLTLTSHIKKDWFQSQLLYSWRSFLVMDQGREWLMATA